MTVETNRLALTVLRRRSNNDAHDGHDGAREHEGECLRVGNVAGSLCKPGEVVLVQDARGNASNDGHDTSAHLPA